MPWFWPIRRDPSQAEDGEIDEPSAEKCSKTEDGEEENVHEEEEEVVYETAEKLDMLTTYLRTTYCYCHWCGTHYEDAADLQQNCPGETKDDH